MNEHTFNLTANTSVRLLTGGKYCDRDIIINVTEAGDTGPVVAKIGDTGYTSVKKALEAAQSGETVTMVADSNESDATLLLNEGVTLDLGTYTLVAKALFGVNGSYVTGTVYSATNAYAKLKVGTLKLGEMPHENSAYDILPVYVADCYVFTRFNVYEGGASKFEVTDEHIQLVFSQQLTGNLRTALAGNYSAEANDLRIIVKVTWAAEDGSYNLEFVFSDIDVNTVLGSLSAYYVFTLTGYEAIGLTESNMNTLKVQAMAVTDSGVVSSGTLWTNSAN